MPTKVITTEKYLIESSNVSFDRKNNVILSKDETKIIDKESNSIFLNNFEYLTKDNIFKSIGKISVLDNLGNSYKFSQVYFIIGGTKEKNWPEICKILPSYYKYIITQPNNERSLSIDKLKKEFDRNKLNYLSFSSFQSSINYCKKNARKNDLIFIGGSLFMLS